MTDSTVSRSVWWVNPLYLCTVQPYEGAIRVVEADKLQDTPLGELLNPILGAKLDDMRLRDRLRAYDEGYTAAINELREWMEGSDAE